MMQTQNVTFKAFYEALDRNCRPTPKTIAFDGKYGQDHDRWWDAIGPRDAGGVSAQKYHVIGHFRCLELHTKVCPGRPDCAACYQNDCCPANGEPPKRTPDGTGEAELLQSIYNRMKRPEMFLYLAEALLPDRTDRLLKAIEPIRQQGGRRWAAQAAGALRSDPELLPWQAVEQAVFGQAKQPGICVRLAREDEREAVNRLRRQVNDLHTEGRPEVFKPGFGPELENFLDEMFRDPDRDVAVAELDGKLVGLAILRRTVRPETPYMYERRYLDVEELCVDGDARRQGVGTALIDFARSRARERGLGRIELSMWEFNRGALDFYRAAGFSTCRRIMGIVPEERDAETE